MPTGVYKRKSLTKKHKKNISKGLKKAYKEGNVFGFQKGFRHTEEAKRKISEAKKGKNHPMYIDGRSSASNYKKEYSKKYNQEHKKERKEYRKKLAQNPQYRLNRNMRRDIWEALKGNKEGRKWESLVGYTSKDLYKHLESLFEPWMNWDNWGRIKKGEKRWQIDHIKPQSLFNYKSPEDKEFKKCWSLSNLQPLEARENLRKHNKYNY